MKYREEKDSMGTVNVPEEAYYGSQTQRAADNFPISGMTLSAEFIQSLALIKSCAARVNSELELLEAGLADAGSVVLGFGENPLRPRTEFLVGARATSIGGFVLLRLDAQSLESFREESGVRWMLREAASAAAASSSGCTSRSARPRRPSGATTASTA